MVNWEFHLTSTWYGARILKSRRHKEPGVGGDDQDSNQDLKGICGETTISFFLVSKFESQFLHLGQEESGPQKQYLSS